MFYSSICNFNTSLKSSPKKYVLPLEVLNQFIEKILHHNYTSHIKTKANDEIAQLAQNLNRLSLYLQNLETTSKAKAQSDNNLIIKQLINSIHL